ncbi:STAS domain-containing protein [Christiangramia forsetii]|uniref:STAS domain-containing protein n=2 Tax=Christiangramia forsetii TaxID=411153 RepID=A0LZM1_CHRFK|nr:STAS domain-containing protein [Christiangramia forsetii]GGG38624.1 hypothetical protein GCM10011532_23040 [Christiangramia forsetii]CAL65816.1 hypothetical protein GFO_0842 [Christiangramia forsetii KT0803]
MEIEKDNVIKLMGRLDSTNVSEIEEQLEEILDEKESLVIDLNELETLDISGIFMLFSFKHRAHKEYKTIEYLLNSSKVITGNIFGINMPSIV